MSDDRPHVWVQPELHGGTPCVGGTGIGVEAIAGYVWAGDPPSLVARMYGVSLGDVLVACWFVATAGDRAWRKRWGGWAEVVEPDLGRYKTVDYASLPLPPTKQQSEGAG